MLLSIAYIILIALFFGWICKELHFPNVFGMLIAGILLGPSMLNLIDQSILNSSLELYQIALIILLLRTAFSLETDELKNAGKPTLLMSFLPACCEIAGTMLLAPMILGISILEGALLGTVLSAVSSGIVIPKMNTIKDEQYGMNKGIPQLLLTSTPRDNMIVILLFSAYMELALTPSTAVPFTNIVNVPISLILGIVLGSLLGILLSLLFTKVHIRDTIKVLILLAISFILIALEKHLSLPIAAFIAILCCGMMIRKRKEKVAGRLFFKFGKLWVAAEIMLFVLVGATVSLETIQQSGFMFLLLIIGALTFRMIGVFLCLLKTDLTNNERIFCMISYLPKTAIQAAIGGIPLTMGFSSGNTILTICVLAILITAPLGAFGIELSYQKLLVKSQEHSHNNL